MLIIQRALCSLPLKISLNPHDNMMSGRFFADWGSERVTLPKLLTSSGGVESTMHGAEMNPTVL